MASKIVDDARTAYEDHPQGVRLMCAVCAIVAALVAGGLVSWACG